MAPKRKRQDQSTHEEAKRNKACADLQNGFNPFKATPMCDINDGNGFLFDIGSNSPGTCNFASCSGCTPYKFDAEDCDFCPPIADGESEKQKGSKSTKKSAGSSESKSKNSSGAKSKKSKGVLPDGFDDKTFLEDSINASEPSRSLLANNRRDAKLKQQKSQNKQQLTKPVNPVNDGKLDHSKVGTNMKKGSRKKKPLGIQEEPKAGSLHARLLSRAQNETPSDDSTPVDGDSIATQSLNDTHSPAFTAGSDSSHPSHDQHPPNSTTTISCENSTSSELFRNMQHAPVSSSSATSTSPILDQASNDANLGSSSSATSTSVVTKSSPLSETASQIDNASNSTRNTKSTRATKKSESGPAPRKGKAVQKDDAKAGNKFASKSYNGKKQSRFVDSKQVNICQRLQQTADSMQEAKKLLLDKMDPSSVSVTNNSAYNPSAMSVCNFSLAEADEQFHADDEEEDPDEKAKQIERELADCFALFPDVPDHESDDDNEDGGFKQASFQSASFTSPMPGGLYKNFLLTMPALSEKTIKSGRYLYFPDTLEGKEALGTSVRRVVREMQPYLGRYCWDTTLDRYGVFTERGPLSMLGLGEQNDHKLFKQDKSAVITETDPGADKSRKKKKTGAVADTEDTEDEEEEDMDLDEKAAIAKTENMGKHHFHIHLKHGGNHPIQSGSRLEQAFHKRKLAIVVRCADANETTRPHYHNEKGIQSYLSDPRKEGHVDFFPLYRNKYRIIPEICKSQKRQINQILAEPLPQDELFQLWRKNDYKDIPKSLGQRRVFLADKITEHKSLNDDDKLRTFYKYKDFHREYKLWTRREMNEKAFRELKTVFWEGETTKRWGPATDRHFAHTIKMAIGERYLFRFLSFLLLNSFTPSQISWVIVYTVHKSF